ncbi:hypothetical protein SAMN04487898_12254 [Pedobacter sp. ok626]|uniref:hypothetical protein n=1 Tax=Pedobacter sp. ok626 TaxID=1761882 RepID=UPI000887D131|nr:hypothetical protein [Pedobacter sp. ok626]SDL66107.1 hypothetical protein SAMN04487898_12254 [Pedobacter sp. ok626]
MLTLVASLTFRDIDSKQPIHSASMELQQKFVLMLIKLIEPISITGVNGKIIEMKMDDKVSDFNRQSVLFLYRKIKDAVSFYSGKERVHLEELLRLLSTTLFCGKQIQNEMI